MNKSIILVIIAAFFSAIGQILYKYAGNNLDNTLMSFILNPFVYLGILCYGIGFVFMLKALLDNEVTIVYPIMSTSFIFIVLISSVFFPNDIMTFKKWIGIIIIILGTYCVAKGGKK